MSARSLSFTQIVNASPATVYKAFTNATALREWICDVSTVDPKPGGRLYMAWNSGYFACGEYTSLETDKKIAFTWYGREEPGASRVEVSLVAESDGTNVHLVHAVPESGKAWEEVCKELEKGWKRSLENLASVLETGADLRITRRPMLGIALSDFNAELAKKMGVPVSEGYRLASVLDGMGAQAAGLQSNDVIVSFNGQEVRKGADLTNALASKQAGDRVEVVFYRSSKKQTVEMLLSGRRLPEMPNSLDGLSEAAKRLYGQQIANIESLFAGVSEKEASFKPNKTDWSAKEVLAHLIHSERFFQTFVWDLLGGQERWSDRYAGNLAAPIQATITAFPTLRDLLRELSSSFSETLALFANLPSEFIEAKGSFWRLALATQEGTYHFQLHLDQIQNAIESARVK